MHTVWYFLVTAISILNTLGIIFLIFTVWGAGSRQVPTDLLNTLDLTGLDDMGVDVFYVYKDKTYRIEFQDGKALWIDITT